MLDPIISKKPDSIIHAGEQTVLKNPLQTPQWQLLSGEQKETLIKRANAYITAYNNSVFDSEYKLDSLYLDSLYKEIFSVLSIDMPSKDTVMGYKKLIDSLEQLKTKEIIPNTLPQFPGFEAPLDMRQVIEKYETILTLRDAAFMTARSQNQHMSR